MLSTFFLVFTHFVYICTIKPQKTQLHFYLRKFDLFFSCFCFFFLFTAIIWLQTTITSFCCCFLLFAKKDAKSKTSIYHLNNHRQLQRQQLKLKQKKHIRNNRNIQLMKKSQNLTIKLKVLGYWILKKSK